jgi:signal transduction histidine kinase
MRILLVEDNPFDADLARRALADAGVLPPVHAATLAAARDALADLGRFDLLLTDLNLPDGQGLDLIAEVRARGLPLAVVALTGQGDEGLVLAVLKAGADDYLAKSDGYERRLPTTVHAALTRYRSDHARHDQRLRVLYAEHNALDIDLTRRHLAAHAAHLQLDCVQDVDAALARLPTGPDQAVTQDVLLVDFRLVGDSGLELLKRVREDRGLDLPVVMVTGQGSEDVAARAIRLGATDYVVKRDNYLLALPAVLENAYHRVQAQREQSALRELNASLERKVAERTAELAAAKDMAESANRSKSAFLARMSHDLRTPLNAVLGFSQLLALEPAIKASAANQRQVRHIQDAGEHLLAMIDEVLDLARIETGGLRLRPEAVDTAALVQECLMLVGPLAAQHQVRLHQRLAAGTPPARADRTRLRQVLVNLLTNAIKYNRPQGDATVSLSADVQGVVLRVEDNGRGLSPDQLSQLFQPFNRVGAETSGIEGTGLGLVIARQLVEAMQGQLQVCSSVGQGSTFTLTLPTAGLEADAAAPLPARQLASAASAPSPIAHARRRQVLYIEDNAVNLRLMQDLLAGRPDLQLQVAVDGPSGLAAARRQRPDVVLMDLDLPGLSGHEVLRQLKADPATAGLRCVAVSANALDDEILQALQAGFAGYLTKPFLLDQLFSALEGTDDTDG